MYENNNNNKNNSIDEYSLESPTECYKLRILGLICIILFSYYSNIKNTTTQATNSVYNLFSSAFSGLSSFFSLSDNF